MISTAANTASIAPAGESGSTYKHWMSYFWSNPAGNFARGTSHASGSLPSYFHTCSTSLDAGTSRVSQPPTVTSRSFGTSHARGQFTAKL